MKIASDIPSIEIASELAAQFEGLSLVPYICPGGFVTIGYGHLLSRDKSKKPEDYSEITHDRAVELLQQDLVKALRGVRRLITIDLNDNQEAALIDFCYNLGSGNLQVSTLRKVVNRGDFDEVPNQLRRWVYANRRKLRGLVIRREAEAQLFMS